MIKWTYEWKSSYAKWSKFKSAKSCWFMDASFLRIQNEKKLKKLNEKSSTKEVKIRELTQIKIENKLIK